MSKTVREIRDRVIENLQDFDRSKPVFTIPQYDLAIKGAYQNLASRMPWPHVDSGSLLTITAGSDTFTLQTNLGGDVRIRLRSNGNVLTNVTREEIDMLRSGHPAPETFFAIPYAVALWREVGSSGTDLHGRCYPGAKVSEVCDVFYDKIPDELVGPALNTQNVLFDTTAAEALVLKVSATMLRRTPADEVAKLKINPEVVKEWDADLERMLYRAAATWNDIQSAGYTHRYVP